MITDIDVTLMARSRMLPGRHDALLLRYAGIVRHIAYHLFRRHNYVDVDDLIDAGKVGVSAAIPGDAHDKAEFFQACAGVRIRGAMLDFVRKSHRSLRASCGARRSIEEEAITVKSPRRDATPRFP